MQLRQMAGSGAAAGSALSMRPATARLSASCTDADPRIGLKLEADILRIAADDRRRMHHDRIVKVAISRDDGVSMHHAARAETRAVLDHGGGVYD